jgi:hypothetical protein
MQPFIISMISSSPAPWCSSQSASSMPTSPNSFSMIGDLLARATCP